MLYPQLLQHNAPLPASLSQVVDNQLGNDSKINTCHLKCASNILTTDMIVLPAKSISHSLSSTDQA
eukprot:1005946-Amphidinium_carterae.1